ncbi:MAG: hypothetical protein EAZ53_04650 [Bacteroidetes bacterium]|nr:MAG: hypothetical protein EAZ53_04650 [Bacteroidota bacterium]
MHIIGLLLIWGSLIYLIYFHLKSKSEFKKKTESLEQIHHESTNEVKNQLREIYGDEIAESPYKKEMRNIQIGMPDILVKLIWGNPNEKKETFDGITKSEQWFYGESTYRYAGETRKKFNTKLVLENGYLVSWQDL